MESGPTAAEDLSHGHDHGDETHQLGRFQRDNEATGLFLVAHDCNGTASALATRLVPEASHNRPEHRKAG